MTSLPRLSKKFIKLGVSFLIFSFFPHSRLSSCFFGVSEMRENYYFSLFQSDIANAGSLEPFLYHIWDYDDMSKSFELKDSAHYAVNIAEWQEEIAHEASDIDINTILYQLDSKKIKDNEKRLSDRNTFIRAVKKRPELWAYLKFAKETENIMSGIQGDWNDNDTKNKVTTRKKLIEQGNNMANSANSIFIKLRSAYLTIKLKHYAHDSVGVRTDFNKYFKNATSKSWVVGSSYFYHAMAHSDLVQRNVLYAQAFNKSIDKRKLTVQYFTSDSLDLYLKATKDKSVKAGLLTMFAIQISGPQLENIKKVYQLEPQNKDLGLLVHREVNKLEDWLVTPEITHFKDYDDEFYVQKEGDEYSGRYVPMNEDESDEDYKKRVEIINKNNRKKDLNYASDVSNFVSKLISDKKQETILPLLLSSLAHLNFIRKDWVSFNKSIQLLEAIPNVSKSIKSQLKLTKFIANMAQVTDFNAPSVQNELLDFFEYLDNNKTDIPNYKRIRSQLALFCANEFLRRHDIAKCVLMLSKTDRTWGAYADVLEKNLYHQLLEVGEPKDYESLLDMINKSNKSRLETFLTNEPLPYIGNTDSYYSEKEQKWVTDNKSEKWDINKIKEYKSMYYLRHNELQKAYDVISEIPESFWNQRLFKEYMNVNTFHVNLRRPHTNVSEDSFHFNKKQILRKIIDLKNEVDKDPVKSADNNLWLGNAYYNMSYVGNSWLMWDVYDKSDILKDPLSIAAQYFENGMEKSVNPKIAGYCLYMANLCKNSYTELENVGNAYSKNFKKRFPNESQYTTIKYWCGDIPLDKEDGEEEKPHRKITPFLGIQPTQRIGLFFNCFVVAFALIAIFLKFKLYDN